MSVIAKGQGWGDCHTQKIMFYEQREVCQVHASALAMHERVKYQLNGLFVPLTPTVIVFVQILSSDT